MQKIIERIERQLRWSVTRQYTPNECEITSDPWARTHTILLPTQAYRAIEYLHELAHAVLGEQHHLLSSAIFVQGTAKDVCNKLINPFRTASDWLADDLLIRWCPEEERAEIREHIGYMQIIAGQEKGTEAIYCGGLMFAQGVKYLGQNPRHIPPVYRPAANILLSVDPGKPSVTVKRDLVNRLASLTCRERIALTKEDGMELWKIK